MLNPTELIQSGGLLFIALIIFAESGMLLGFFFPGDTLLLSAGVFAAQGKLPLAGLLLVVAIAAIAGDNVGYQIGKTTGPRLFRKKDGLLFRHEYIERSQKFFERYGNKTMLLAHFVPVIRTFTPIVAGVGKMPRAQFVLFDAIGDTAWAVIVTMLGFWFGSKIPNIDQYILPVVGLAIIFSFGPMVYHIIKALLEKRSSKKASK
ncbi:MAG TPA: DedA family protein [Candidatus Saccharimonadales bacterium]|nr:DedA family protein [Candidatus Saccharimonadales bacterium]